MLRNPFWHALSTVHARFALGVGPTAATPGGLESARPALALRYPPDILPFAAIAEMSVPALRELAALLTPGEPIYITDLSDAPPVPTPELTYLSLLPGLQMLLRPQSVSAFPHATAEIAFRKLEQADAPALVALTDRAFPGFFRRNTIQLGSYYGIHDRGELVAMAGERVALPGFRELSAVCTHPDHRGKLFAATLMGLLARDHAAAGLCSILHVSAANTSAIRLYEHLGFESLRPIFFHRLQRL